MTLERGLRFVGDRDLKAAPLCGQLLVAPRRLFAQYGEVVSVVLPTDRETGRPRGFGFVAALLALTAVRQRMLAAYDIVPPADLMKRWMVSCLPSRPSTSYSASTSEWHTEPRGLFQ